VSDTPRTESFNCYDNGCDNPLHAWGAFSAELERELKSANERIKRLEEALESIREYWNRDNNNQALIDACWYAIDKAAEALETKEDKL
jgi:hypothetical protein